MNYLIGYMCNGNHYSVIENGKKAVKATVDELRRRKLHPVTEITVRAYPNKKR